jgi:aconitate hydratase
MGRKTLLVLNLSKHLECTTDHISMAGPWLRFRGHLDNISNNMLIVLSMHTTKTNSVKNQLTGVYDAVPAAARAQSGGCSFNCRRRSQLRRRILGSMRCYGNPWSKAVLVKSFARIHETNQKTRIVRIDIR